MKPLHCLLTAFTLAALTSPVLHAEQPVDSASPAGPPGAATPKIYETVKRFGKGDKSIGMLNSSPTVTSVEDTLPKMIKDELQLGIASS